MPVSQNLSTKCLLAKIYFGQIVFGEKTWNRQSDLEKDAVLFGRQHPQANNI
jgi:hypothetical protein